MRNFFTLLLEWVRPSTKDGPCCRHKQEAAKQARLDKIFEAEFLTSQPARLHDLNCREVPAQQQQQVHTQCLLQQRLPHAHPDHPQRRLQPENDLQSHHQGQARPHQQLQQQQQQPMSPQQLQAPTPALPVRSDTVHLQPEALTSCSKSCDQESQAPTHSLPASIAGQQQQQRAPQQPHASTLQMCTPLLPTCNGNGHQQQAPQQQQKGALPSYDVSSLQGLPATLHPLPASTANPQAEHQQQQPTDISGQLQAFSISSSLSNGNTHLLQAQQQQQQQQRKGPPTSSSVPGSGAPQAPPHPLPASVVSSQAGGQQQQQHSLPPAQLMPPAQHQQGILDLHNRPRPRLDQRRDHLQQSHAPHFGHHGKDATGTGGDAREVPGKQDRQVHVKAASAEGVMGAPGTGDLGPAPAQLAGKPPLAAANRSSRTGQDRATGPIKQSPAEVSEGPRLQGEVAGEKQQQARGKRAGAKRPGAPAAPKPRWSVAKPGTLQGQATAPGPRQEAGPAHPKQVAPATMPMSVSSAAASVRIVEVARAASTRRQYAMASRVTPRRPRGHPPWRW